MARITKIQYDKIGAVTKVPRPAGAGNVSKIPVPTYTGPVIKLPPNAGATTQTAESAMQKLNDPLQLNTALDVLFNTAGLKKAYGTSDLNARLKAVRDITVQQYWQPFKQGNWKTLGINTLLNVGESVDVLGNMGKSLLPQELLNRTADIDYDKAIQYVTAVQDGQAKEHLQPNGELYYTATIDGAVQAFSAKDLELYETVVNSGRTVNLAKLTMGERFKASIGLGEYGRLNFDADTGNFLADVVLELALDPETWITFGASATKKIVTSQADNFLKFFAKRVDDLVQNKAITQDIANLAVDEVARKQTASTVVKLLQQKTLKVEVGNKELNELMENILGKAVKPDSINNIYKLTDVRAAVNYTLAKQGIPYEVLTNKEASELLQRSITKRVNRMTVNVARGTNMGLDVVNKTQSVLLKAALTPSGIYPIYAIAKKAGPGVAALVLKHVLDAEAILSNEFGNRPLMSYLNEDFVKDRSTRTIMDMLSDDTKYLYRNPGDPRVLRKQMIEDLYKLSEWARGMADDPERALQLCTEVREFFRKSQGVELEDLEAVIKAVLAKAPKGDEAIEQYLKYIQDFVPRIKHMESVATKQESLKALEDFTSVFYGSDEKLAVSQFSNLPKRVADRISSVDNPTLVDFEYALKEHQKEILNELRELTAPIVATSEDADVYTKMMFYQVAEELKMQRKEILQNLADLFGEDKVYKIEHYNSIFDDVAKQVEDKDELWESIRQAIVEAEPEFLSILKSQDVNLTEAMLDMLTTVDEPMLGNFLAVVVKYQEEVLDKLNAVVRQTLEAARDYVPANQIRVHTKVFKKAAKEVLDAQRAVIKDKLSELFGESKAFQPKHYDVLFTKGLSDSFGVNLGQVQTLFSATGSSSVNEKLYKLYKEYIVALRKTLKESTRDRATNLSIVFGKDSIADMQKRVQTPIAEYINTLLNNLSMGTFEDFVKPQDVIDGITTKHTAFDTAFESILEKANHIKKVDYEHVVTEDVDTVQSLLEASDYWGEGVDRYDVEAEFWETIADAYDALDAKRRTELVLTDSAIDAKTGKKVGGTVDKSLQVCGPYTFDEYVYDLLDAELGSETHIRCFNGVMNNLQKMRQQLASEIAEVPSPVVAEANLRKVGDLPEETDFFTADTNKAITDITAGANILFMRGKEVSDNNNSLMSVVARIDKTVDMLDATISPSSIDNSKALYTAYEELVSVKKEQFHTLMGVFAAPETVSLMRELQTGDLGLILQNIITNKDLPEISERLYTSAVKAQDIVDNYNRMQRLIYDIQLSNMSNDAKASFFATIMKYWHVSPEKFSSQLNYWADEIIENIPSYIQYTKQYNKKLSINGLMKDAKYTDTMQRVFKSAGLEMPEVELHLGSSDTLPPLAVMYKEAETNPALDKLVKENCLISIDGEAMNANVKADMNVFHQFSMQVQKDKTHVGTHTFTLSDDGIKNSMPGRDYKLELYDSNQHATKYAKEMDYAGNVDTDAGLLPEFLYDMLDEDEVTDPVLKSVTRTGYNPRADYTDIDLDDFYLKHITSDAGERADTEAEMLLAFLQKMHSYVTANTVIDPITKKPIKKAVLVTHNGKAFDMPALKNKIRSLELYDMAAVDERYGFDLHFLDDIEVFDTLEYSRKKAGYFELTSAEEGTIREALLRYADGISDSGKIFTAITPADITRLQRVVRDVGANDMFGHVVAIELADITKKLDATREVLAAFYRDSKQFKKVLYPADIFRAPQHRGAWEQVMREHLDKTVEEIAATFGEGMSNMQLSSIFAAAGDYQTYAYTWRVQPKLMDRWFKGTFTRTAAGEVTNSEALRLTKVAKTLDSLSGRARNYETLASYKTKMNDAIQKMFANGTGKFKYIEYLRTESLNIPETWAVFKYLADKHDADELRKVLFGVSSITQLTEDQKMLLALLQDGQSFTNSSADKYLKLLGEDSYGKTKAYMAKLNDLLNIRENFEGMSRWTDHEGMLGGGALIEMKAMEPVTNVLTEMSAWIHKAEYAERLEFYAREQKMTNRLAIQITQQFVDSSADGTLRWLAHSKGHVVIPITTFLDYGGKEGYDNFISKFATADYVGRNIGMISEGEYVWVYLKRSANFRVRVDPTTGTKSMYANGELIEDVVRTSFNAASFKEVYEGVLSPQTLQKAIDAIDFMTDGASVGTVYDSYTQSAFDKLYDKMPAAMQADFYDKATLSNAAHWGTDSFNKSVLGDLSSRGKLGIGHGGQFVSALSNATDQHMTEHGVKLSYVQSMFSESNSFRNTKLGKLIESDPGSVAKWFKENRNFTAAGLVVDKKHKQGYKIVEYDMTTKRGVQKALQANAKLVSYSEFNKLYEVINSNVFSESSARGWQHLVRLYKIGYLGLPGTWGRNGLDTFLKNMLTTETGPAEMGKAYAVAMSTIHKYDDIVVTLNNLGGGSHFPPEAVIAKFFKNNPNMSHEEFKLLTNFFSDPSAGGESRLFTKLNAKSRKQYLKQLHNAEAITDAQYIDKRVRNTFQSVTNTALAPMNGIERVARLAAFQTLTKQGRTSDTALRLIDKAHFAYSVKSEVEQTLEMIVPFYTFINRNFTYWMDAIDNNGAYFGLIRDVLEPALNLEQYSTEELESNAALQRNVLSGNIPMASDFQWSANFSFMDALGWLTDPVDSAKSAIFSPVQAFINVWLQNAADENFLQGQEAMSNWMQGTFGLKMTKEQVEAKYGAWAAEYKKLYDFKISNLGEKYDSYKDILSWQLMPLIGSQLQRAYITGTYYDDESLLRKALYFTGLATKVNRWDDIKISKLVNKELGGLIHGSEQAMALYTRLKAAMGYSGVAFQDLPYAAKEDIYAMMNGTEPPYDAIPVIKDADAMLFIWTGLKRQYDVEALDFKEIPQATLNEMYFEIAKSAITVANIQKLLSEDENARRNYSIARKNLGLEGLKVYQLPLDALEVIEAAMLGNAYGFATQSTVRRTPRYSSSYQKRTYAKKTYTGAESPGSRTGYYGVTPYSTKKGVHANYGHAFAQKQIRRSHKNIYSDNYTKTGKSRIDLLMIPVTPQNLKYRMKETFNYYK